MTTPPSPSLLPITTLGEPPPTAVAAVAVGDDERMCIICGGAAGLYRTHGRDDATAVRWARLAQAPIGVLSIAMSPNFARDRRILVGAHRGAFFSNDAGDTWTPAHMPIHDSAVAALRMSPHFAADGIAVAGTLEDGVLYSADHGATWESRSIGMLDGAVLSLCFSPHFDSDRTIYAGAETALYYSYNGAKAWKQLDFPEDGGPIISLLAAPLPAGDGCTLFAGTESSGLYRSRDAGETWNSAALPGACVNALVLHPTLRIVAATERGVFHSNDDGETWICLQEHAGILTMDASRHGLVVATFDDGLYASADGVDRRSLGGPAMRSMTGLAVHPEFDRRALAYMFGPQEYLWTSEDGGRSWRACIEGDAPSDIAALGVHQDRSGRCVLIAAGSAGLHRSHDDGRSWMPLIAEPALACACDADGRMILVGLSSGELRLTRDGGSAWTNVNTPWGAGGRILSMAHSANDAFFVAVQEKLGEEIALWRSDGDGFRELRRRPCDAAQPMMPMIAWPSADDIEWCAGFGNQAWAGDGRANKRIIASQIFTDGQPGEAVISLIEGHTDGAHELFTSTGRRLFRSTDALTWSQITDFGDERAVDLRPSPRFGHDRALYALLLGGRLCRIDVPR